MAIEFIYIFFLETIATKSAKTSKVFGMDKEALSRKSVNTLFKNQGVYNELLYILIFVAVFAFASKAAVIALMLYIIGVAIYGSFTSNHNIYFTSGRISHCYAYLMFLLTGTFETNNYKRKIITLYPFNVSNYSDK